MPVLIAFAVSLSLLYFKLDADWDNWAAYFFGSYGLGVVAWWASDTRRKPVHATAMMAMTVLPALAALALEYRSRIALALAVACVLFLFGRVKMVSEGRAWSAINGLAKVSYSVFLIHFPVCLLVNGAFTRFAPAEAEWQAFGMLVAWSASLAAGAAFFKWVEVPLARFVQRTVGQNAIRPATA